METLLAIIMIAVVVIITKIPEWRSSNRIPPDGYRTDWNKATSDISKYGKDYYYKQHLAGKYDIPKEKYDKNGRGK